ncbi:MAG: zinc-binding dehydrogenase [Halobacteriales archaeon]|nr:zinc-binding dehydrogenase [Halobacteriales archaeon]
MRAAAFVYEGDEPAVAVRDVDDPEAADGEAIVQVEACSLNHSDRWTLRGARFDEPYVSGADLAGVVESAPDDAAVSTGDRVVLCPNLTCGTCAHCREGPENLCEEYAIYYGGFAERAAVPADRLVPIPDGVSFVEAAALPIAYMTARHMLRRGRFEPADTVFIPGATGGVGIAGAQLALGQGARVVGTTRSASKADRLRALGVDVIVSDEPDELEEAVADLGADVALNHLGGAFTAVCMAGVKRGGRVVVCGRTAGDRSTVDVSDLFWQHKRLIGSSMGTQRDLERLVALVDAGHLEPVVDTEYPLEETPAAFEAMADRTLFGKAVIRPNA